MDSAGKEQSGMGNTPRDRGTGHAPVSTPNWLRCDSGCASLVTGWVFQKLQNIIRRPSLCESEGKDASSPSGSTARLCALPDRRGAGWAAGRRGHPPKLGVRRAVAHGRVLVAGAITTGGCPAPGRPGLGSHVPWLPRRAPVVAAGADHLQHTMTRGEITSQGSRLGGRQGKGARRRLTLSLHAGPCQPGGQRQVPVS